MKRLLLLLALLIASPAAAQLPPAGGIVVDNTPVQGGNTTNCLYITSARKVGAEACGGVPSGAAGGDLTGTYPNPTLAASVTSGAHSWNGAQTILTGSVASSIPALNVAQTWNNSGTTFTGILGNFTNVSSAAASILADLQLNGSSLFRVDRTQNWLQVPLNIDQYTYLQPNHGGPVEVSIGDLNGDGISELRLIGSPVQLNSSFSLYWGAASKQAFIETWRDTGEATLDISPKSKNLTSDEVIQFFRNGETAGNRRFEIYDGGSGGALQTMFQGRGNSYVAAATGMFGVGSVAGSPLATFHVQGVRGATTNELERLTKTVGGTALGLSFGYTDSGSTEAYIYNRSSDAAATIKLGFNTTLGSSAALTLTGALSALFGANMTIGPMTAPASPATAGQWTFYVDSGDGNKLKAKASTGAVVTLGTP